MKNSDSEESTITTSIKRYEPLKLAKYDLSAPQGSQSNLLDYLRDSRSLRATERSFKIAILTKKVTHLRILLTRKKRKMRTILELTFRMRLLRFLLV